MSKALTGILEGVVLIGLGILTGGTSLPAFFSKFLISAGATLLLGGVSTLLSKSPRAPPVNGVGVSYSGTLEPRRIIYGLLKVGGMNVIPPLTSGGNNEMFHQVLALAGHPVDAIYDVYFGAIRIPAGAIGSITGSANDGKITGIPAPLTGQVNGQPFNNLAWIRRYEGRQTAVDYILNHAFAVWDSNHIGKDIAYLAMQFQYDQNVYSTGVPVVTAMVGGKRVYDPRSDSTNGGVGSQRMNDSTTWVFSQNPALCLRDYLTSSLGLDEDNSRIDDTLVAAAANVCDERVTVPLPTLVGLTQWTSGSANVFGSNTYFTTAGLAGGYVRAPNGTMLLVDTVNSDTEFTLHAAYPGATAGSQVTAYNTSGTSLAVTQPRYSCDVALDATARFEDNISQLATAMMGHCFYSGGRWQMYAGQWPGESFELDATELVGGINVQAATPRTDLYNSVRGNFIDPQQNYQPAEFAPILIQPYIDEDNGEIIYVETSFPCCTNGYEAQRNAIVLARLSRNRRIVTGTWGLAGYGVRTFGVGRVTISEIGWVDQTVRCISWKFTPTGAIELVLQEAYPEDWADPDLDQYSISEINTAPIPLQWLPYPPTGLTATSVPGAIDFVVNLPDQVLPGTRILLLENTAPSPASSAIGVATVTADRIHLLKSDTVTRYYWVQTVGPSGQVSDPYPPTTGVAGVALTALEPPWLPFGFMTINEDNVAYKQGTSVDAWDSMLISLNAYTTCHVQGKASNSGEVSFVALSDNPVEPFLDDMDFALVYSGGTAYCYQDGTQLASGVAADPSSLLAIVYNGTHATFEVEGVAIFTTSTGDSGKTLHGICAVWDHDGRVNSLAFGPTTDLAVIDTGQLGDNAASQILSAFYQGVSPFTTYGISYTPSVPVSTFTAVGISQAITTKGGLVAIDVMANAVLISTLAGTTGWDVKLVVFCDGVECTACPEMEWGSGTGVFWTAGPNAQSYPCAFSFVDSPAAGAHTYDIRMKGSTSGGTLGGRAFLYQITFKVREIKR